MSQSRSWTCRNGKASWYNINHRLRQSNNSTCSLGFNLTVYHTDTTAGFAVVVLVLQVIPGSCVRKTQPTSGACAIYVAMYCSNASFVTLEFSRACVLVYVGSHKRSFGNTPPTGLDLHHPILHCPAPKKGDLICFSEALTHGARKWPDQHQPRVTVFLRYKAKWHQSYWCDRLAEHRDVLSEAVRELELPDGPEIKLCVARAAAGARL